MSAQAQTHKKPPPFIWLWISGRDLDGDWRTDATWLHDATMVLHKTKHATRWQRMRHWKRSAIRQAFVVLIPVSAWDWWHHPVLTPAILSLLAATPGSYYAWRAARTFLPVRHYWQWVRPFRHTLKAELGVVPERLAIEPDRSKAVIVLPEEFLGTEPARAAITKAVTAKLGIEAPDATWQLLGRKHEAIFTLPLVPPLEVTPASIRPAVEAAKWHEIVLGGDQAADPYIRSLASETPHVGICMPTGDGKSAFAMSIGWQLLFHGWVLIVLDLKMMSHMWADGLDNVVYAYTPAMIHEALMWLACDDYQESELTYRAKIGRATADIRGNVQGDLGPPIGVLCEELNITQNALKKYWRKIGGKGPSPACEALDRLAFIGRGLKTHVFYIAQRLSARATSGSGSADSRENIGLWVFSGGTSEKTFKLLTDGHVMPPPTAHKGRYTVVYRQSVDMIQAPYLLGKAEEQAREFAMSGTTAKPHRDLPFTRHDAVVPMSVLDTRALPMGSGQGVVGIGQGQPLRPPNLVTLSEAHAAGVFAGRTKQAVQRASTRPGFAPARGWDGKAKLYDRNDLYATQAGKELVNCDAE